MEQPRTGHIAKDHAEAGLHFVRLAMKTLHQVLRFFGWNRKISSYYPMVEEERVGPEKWHGVCSPSRMIKDSHFSVRSRELHSSFEELVLERKSTPGAHAQ
jgi:hypothetical protein